MKRILISITVTTLLALPLLAAGQSTPIPPEAARQSPLTQTGEQDISRQLPEQGQRHIPTTLPREDATYNMVSRAQEELRELGYNPGPIDGIMGARTRQALRRYQRDYNLAETGRLNAATRQQLLGDERASLPENWRETPPTMGRLMTEGEIQVAEQNLRDFGFDPGPVDGVFTAQTEAALRAVQERRGIPVSGVLDDPTRGVLLKDYNPSPLELPGWPGPFPYDPVCGSRYYSLWRAPLPTEDMLEKALPEGVLAEGGYLRSGFLYFEEVEEDLSRLDFTFELVDATSGEGFGTVRIPFRVREG
jgi:hypothetical protein